MTGMYGVAGMYLGKQFVGFKLVALRYLMNMLHCVRDQQNKYILAQNDAMRLSLLCCNRPNLLTLILPIVNASYTITFLMSSRL